MKQQDGPTLKELRAIAIQGGLTEKEAESCKAKDALKAIIQLQEKAKAKTLEPKKVSANINRQWKGDAAIMRAKWLAQPRTVMMLELRGNEKPGVVEEKTDKNGNFYQLHVSGAYEPVTANGFTWMVPRGVQTRVPLQVAEILGESMTATQKAGREWLIDREDPKTGGSVRNAF